MADPKLGAPTPLAADAAEAMPRVVEAATPDQLFALFVILSQNIAKVRFVDSTDRARVLFETGLPASRESPVAPASALGRAFRATLEEKLVGALSTTRLAEPLPDPVAAALQTLLRPADPSAPSGWAEEPLGARGSRLDTLLEAYTDPGGRAWFRADPATPPATALRPVQRRPTTLDLVFDPLSQTCRVELSPMPEPRTESATEMPVESPAEPAAGSAAELRGESLDDLRRKAPPLPQPAETRLADTYFTAPAAAKYLRVDRSTITRRVASNQLVGFTVFKRALRIPMDQFHEFNVVPGIPEVLALFPNPAATSGHPIAHRSAWAFLAGDLFHGDREPRPIDRLRAAAATGTTELVLADLVRTKESIDRGDHL